MKLRVLFFASLREAVGSGEMNVEIDEGMKVSELWLQLSSELALAPDKVLSAVNQEYVEADYVLTEAVDEVAFFPPVTGG